MRIVLTFLVIFNIVGCVNSVGTVSSKATQTPDLSLTKGITVSSLTISNVSTNGFTTILGFDGDENTNAIATLYYCNQTDSPLCSPTSGDSLQLNRNLSTFSGTVSGLISPYDSGDVLSLIITTTDEDGVTTIETSSQVVLSTPDNAATLINFKISNTTSSSFDVYANFSGDNNANSSATFFYCNRSDSASCDPLTGESVTMQKYGTTYRMSVDSIPIGYDPGDELNVAVALNDADGTLDSPAVSRVTLVSGLDDYPNTLGLIGLWKLNEAPAIDEATIADATGKHPALLNTSDGTTDKSITGVVDKGITFDGINDYIVAPGHPDFDKPTGTKMTFMGWYLRLGSFNEHVPASICTASSNQTLTPVFKDNTTVGYWDGANILAQATVSFDVGVWHQYTVTYDAGSVVIYWDGVQVSSATVSDGAKTSFEFRIGADNYGFYSNMKADEVSFWKRTLTAQEIYSIYNSQK